MTSEELEIGNIKDQKPKPHWEKNEALRLGRLQVPGGWLVQPMFGDGLAFVPEVEKTELPCKAKEYWSW